MGRKQTKKKSKFWYYLYAVVILFLTVANICLGVWLLTYVQSIHIKGNVNSRKNEIMAWVKEDPMTVNSLYTFWKFKSGSYKLPVYLEEVDLRMKAPWSLEIRVKEKEIIGCVLAEDQYLCFDAEGLVLKQSDEFIKDVPVIDGIDVKDTNRFEYMKLKDKKILKRISDLTEEIEKKELKPNRIVWEKNSMDIYFENVCVKLGKSNYEEKLTELPSVIKELEGKKGTLHLEHYTKGSTISFVENKEES